MRSKKEITKEEALSRLEGLCSRSEQCESDLERKLFYWKISAADRREIIERLREGRFVDDNRFARSYANDKARFSAWGPAKIRAELFKKKIKAPVITEALNGVEKGVWKDGLERSYRAKLRSLRIEGELTFEDNQKIYRYLIGRGFPGGAIGKRLRDQNLDSGS
ncbi:MAG: RecX family transcriptional regulator [Muribaculaceae bacterium]|nr:RecX family transcriptional regulator [Muribaculaceae bacterium]